jgi:hypothetical protein
VILTVAGTNGVRAASMVSCTSDCYSLLIPLGLFTHHKHSPVHIDPTRRQ